MALTVLAWPSASQAATIGVTTLNDQFGGAPRCALREAIQAANTDAPFGGCVRRGGGARDTIVLRGGRIYRRTRAGEEDSNAAGDLDVTGRTILEVRGRGRARIDAERIDRVLDLHPGASLVGARLAIRRGELASSGTSLGGGGVLVRAGARLSLRAAKLVGNETVGNGGCSCGGGLRADGTAILRRVAVVRNDAGNSGGGLTYSGERLVLRRSTVASNESGESGGGIVLVSGDAPAEIRRSTIAGNVAGNGGGGLMLAFPGGGPHRATNVTISGNEADVRGGGISRFSGRLRLNAATITRNRADADGDASGIGGGISGGVGSGVMARNSIIAHNFLGTGFARDDCAGPLGPFRHNLIGAGTGCPAGNGSVAATNPRLGPLAANGGPTLTHALRRSSPAIRVAARGSAPGRDQRGVKRKLRPDAGAYERR